MQTFKLILFFLLYANGFGSTDVAIENCNDDANENDSIDSQYDLVHDQGILTLNIDEAKSRKNQDLKKTLGFGSFNSVDGQYSHLLVKNDSGSIEESNSIILIDADLKKWVRHSKSSSPDDDFIA